MFTLLAIALASQTLAHAQEPLPSWNDGPAEQAILAFVKEVTDKSDPKYVAPEDRIATFDQDGTLWVEHPMYTQVMYCLERVPALVEKKPELKTRFLFCSPCNWLFKRILSRFQISGLWLQTHFEIVEDRLLVGFRRGDFLELHSAQHDLFAADRRQALDHVTHCPLSIFVGAVGGE